MHNTGRRYGVGAGGEGYELTDEQKTRVMACKTAELTDDKWTVDSLKPILAWNSDYKDGSNLKMAARLTSNGCTCVQTEKGKTWTTKIRPLDWRRRLAK